MAYRLKSRASCVGFKLTAAACAQIFAEQLATDQAEVSSNKAKIVSGEVVLTGSDAGTFAGGYVYGDSSPTKVLRNAAGAGTAYGDTDASQVLTTATVAGTFDEASRNTNPGVAFVVSGTSYKILGTDYVGTYAPSSTGGGYTGSRVVGIASHWMDKIVHLERPDIRRDNSEGPQREWHAQSAQVRAAIWPATQETRDDYARRDIVVTHSIVTAIDLVARPGDRIVKTDDTARYYVVVGIQDYDNGFMSDVLRQYDAELRYT